MAFNFSATPAPATGAATSGFSFGGAPAPAAGATTTAPAPPSTSLFGGGNNPPAPAPTTGGGLFGSSAPAPATGGGLFGAKPAAPAAPAAGGLFGSTAPAPAAGGGLFGSTAPTPSPAAGGLFGSTAPAPAAGGLFGATPAPSAGGLFGAQPAPAPAAGGLFGATAPVAAPQQMQQQQMQQSFSGNTPYAQLPDNAKRAIDQIYQLMMQHRRTLASVKTMAPSLLSVNDGMNSSSNAAQSVSTSGSNLSPADAAAGSPIRPSKVTDPSSEPLPQQMVALQTQIQTLLQSAETNMIEAKQLKARAGEAAVQAKMHGAWPIENVAARRGVALSSIKGLVKDASVNAQNAQTTPALLGGPAPAGASSTSGGGGGTPASSLNVSGMTNIDAIALQQIMDIRAAHVDRVESMPSPYYWEVLHNFEQRVAMVQRDVEAVRARLAIAEEAERVQSMGGMPRDETSLLLANNSGNVASLILYEGGQSAPLSKRLATLARSQNDLFLRIAAQAARAHDGLEEVKLRYQRFCQQTKGGFYDDPFLKADIEEVSRERELQQQIMQEQLATAPIPQAPVTANAAQPTPSVGGGLFGAKAPASATGGLFGSAPAPATGGGLFGSTAPVPAAGGGLFGSTAPTPAAPAPAGGLFGSNPAPAPAAGGLFGSTPAPAPTGGGLFGAPAPAPAAGGGLFGSTTAPAPAAGGLFAAPTTPASTLAPRKKSGSRSGGRRR